MLTITLGYNSATRLLSFISSSTGGDDMTAGTSGDNNSTTLSFNVTDTDNQLTGFTPRAEFMVYVDAASVPNTRDRPYLTLTQSGNLWSCTVPNYIMAAAIRTFLPVQLVWQNSAGATFASVNMIKLNIATAVGAEDGVSRDYPAVLTALCDVAYDTNSYTLTFTRLNGGTLNFDLSAILSKLGTAAYLDAGTSPGNVPQINSLGKLPASIMPSEITAEHFTVATSSLLTSLHSASSGDSAAALDTGQWYFLYGSYSSMDAWIPVQVDLSEIRAAIKKINDGYIYTQSAAASIWDITHNLGHQPNVQVYDSGGNLILPAVSQVSDNELLIKVTPAITGYAILR